MRDIHAGLFLILVFMKIFVVSMLLFSFFTGYTSPGGKVIQMMKQCESGNKTVCDEIYSNVKGGGHDNSNLYNLE